MFCLSKNWKWSRCWSATKIKNSTESVTNEFSPGITNVSLNWSILYILYYIFFNIFSSFVKAQPVSSLENNWWILYIYTTLSCVTWSHLLPHHCSVWANVRKDPCLRDAPIFRCQCSISYSTTGFSQKHLQVCLRSRLDLSKIQHRGANCTPSPTQPATHSGPLRRWSLLWHVCEWMKPE